MAQQQRVQEYLQRQKIGPLFEDLMAKLINDMPDDPIVYLARTLERKSSRQVSQAMRRSTGDLAHTRSRSPDPGTRKSMTATASGWADSDALAVAKDRSYDKPWMTNTKRTKKTVGISDPKYGTKPEWDSHKKMTGTTFDDLWGSKEVTQKGQRSRSQRSPSPTRATKATWGDSYMDDEDLLFHSYGYRGPYKGRRESDDPLAGEFTVAKVKGGGRKPTTESAASSRSVLKKKDHKSSSARHKKELEKYLQQQRQQKQDSGFEDDRELESDDAIELMENLDDLRREGVKTGKQRGQRGVKVSSTYRQTPKESPVSVGICARCARVMTGGVPSQPAMGASYGDLPDYDYDTSRAPSQGQPESARFTALASDDEFESVSQVTGPRKPVWQDDNGGDALTPRKGTHMFSSHAVPSKGRPMYSPELGPSTSAAKTKHGTTTHSLDYHGGRTSPQTENKAYNKTWSPGAYSDDGQTSRETKATTKDDDDDQFGGKGWQVPTEYDTDSSYYGGGQRSKQTSKSRKAKTYSAY